MFGDGPVQAVTTPFIFNSLQVTVDSKSTTHTGMEDKLYLTSDTHSAE